MIRIPARVSWMRDVRSALASRARRKRVRSRRENQAPAARLGIHTESRMRASFGAKAVTTTAE